MILRKPTQKESKWIVQYTYYPVDVAFEVHTSMYKSDNYLANKIDSDARPFGWGDDGFNPNREDTFDKSPGYLFKREYPTTGVIFHIYLYKNPPRKLILTKEKITEILEGIRNRSIRNQFKRNQRCKLYIILWIVNLSGSILIVMDENISYEL